MNQRIAFLIFFSVFFTVHFLINLYIYRHSRPIFAAFQYGQIIKWIFFAVVLSYPLGRVMEYIVPSFFTDTVIKVGSIWLAAMLYLTLSFFLIDILRLVSWVIQTPILHHNLVVLQRIKIGIYAVTGVILLAGYINALYPRVNRIEISIPKPIEGYQQLRVGVASDIHLGTIIGNGRLKRFVRIMNNEKPDIILLAGDIFDEDLGPVIKNDMGKLLKDLDAPLGVWAVTGNHEFIGGAEAAVAYLTKYGIKVIRDSVATPIGNLALIGREDLQSNMRTGVKRKPLAELVEGIKPGTLTILIDHQPYEIDKAVKYGVDLQVSGHTHHGQLWPLSYITKAMFTVSRGHKQIDDTHIFVSTGYGTWGPPIRVGNRPEVGIITIDF